MLTSRYAWYSSGPTRPVRRQGSRSATANRKRSSRRTVVIAAPGMTASSATTFELEAVIDDVRQTRRGTRLIESLDNREDPAISLTGVDAAPFVAQVARQSGYVSA